MVGLGPAHAGQSRLLTSLFTTWHDLTDVFQVNHLEEITNDEKAMLLKNAKKRQGKGAKPAQVEIPPASSDLGMAKSRL